MDAYRSARESRGESIDPNAMWVAIGTDVVFRWPSLQLAAAHAARGSRAYVYLFDWESPAFGGILGSCHALELPFVFGAVRLPVVQVFSGEGPAVEGLSSQMQTGMAGLRRDGRPQPRRHRCLEPLGSGRPGHHDLRGATPGLSRRRVTRSWPSWSGRARCPPACPDRRTSPRRKWASCPKAGCRCGLRREVAGSRPPLERFVRGAAGPKPSPPGHPPEGTGLGQEWCPRGRSPTGRGRALKPSPVRVRIPPPPRRGWRPFPGVNNDAVEVAVLGPVAVHGAAGPFHRGRGA